jgi:hypothetical protein
MSTREMVPYMPQSQTRTQTNTNQAPPTRDELREQIRNSIKDATDAARAAELDAAREGGRGGDLTIRIPGIPVPPGDNFGGRGDRFDPNNGIPPQVVDISIGFFIMCAVIAIGWPLARAFGRRMERRTETPALNPGMADQLQRIEQAVDAMSIEIERISESQRFLAKLQNAQTPERIV